MTSQVECVTLSDDDCSVDLQNSPVLRKKARSVNFNNNNLDTIVIDEESNLAPSRKNKMITIHDCSIPTLKIIRNKNKPFAQVIDMCLDLEHSDGMIKVINKSLVEAYNKADETYKNSKQFHRYLSKIINRLEVEPHRKYFHIMSLVDTLSLNFKKKRVQLTTIATNLEGSKKQNIPSKNSIDLISDDEESQFEDKREESVRFVEIKSSQEEKENLHNEKDNLMDDDGLSNNQNNLLVPHKEVPCRAIIENSSQSSDEEKTENDDPLKERIQDLEQKIAACKKKVDYYETAEVTNDKKNSSFMLYERYKAKIVSLYKELCELVGNDPVKQHRITLSVAEGQQPGPVKRLEDFINDNIGEDGTPLFPDYYDVVKCVIAANIEDKMQWSKQQVEREANALFTQCGRALQKERQRREYRDLLYHVTPATADQDPADSDPELMRKLQENSRLADKKLRDLLDKYSKLQDVPPPLKSNEPEPSTSANIDGNSSTTSNPNHSVFNYHELNLLEMSDEDSNFEPPEVKLEIPESMIKPERNSSDESEVKQEPINIMELLDDFGEECVDADDLQSSILTVELSSDSSEDEFDV